MYEVPTGRGASGSHEDSENQEGEVAAEWDGQGWVPGTMTSARWQPPWMICFTVLSIQLGRKIEGLDKEGTELPAAPAL